ncbi:MAG: glycosyltransferase family 4 protein [bacterium]
MGKGVQGGHPDLAGKGMNPIPKPVTCVHIITRMDKGGAAENTFLTVKHLDRDRFRPVLVMGPTSESHMSQKERQAKCNELEGLRKDGIQVMVCPYLYRRISPLHDLMAFLWLWMTIRRLNPKIVHTHTSKAGILGRWAAFLNRIPIICHTPHGHIFYGYFGPLIRGLFKWMEKLTGLITKRIVCLTEGEKADHLRLGIAAEDRFGICPSGVDLKGIKEEISPELISEWRRRLGIHENDLVIGTAGRLVEVKGPVFLLDSCTAVLEKKGNAMFCFLGSGPLKEALEQMAEAWDITQRVRFIPWENDPRPILALFDIFVFPSLNEGMGRALVEAMAMKKPVIATRTGGIPDLVHDGVNGLLVPPSDTSAIADAILRLADQPELIKGMGEMGEKMSEAYSLDEMMNRIEAMYQELLEGSGIIPYSYHNKAIPKRDRLRLTPSQ